MRATGIVRRIDDLGRVVIPKEIRRTLRIREGDPLEIYTDRDGEVKKRDFHMMRLALRPVWTSRERKQELLAKRLIIWAQMQMYIMKLSLT